MVYFSPYVLSFLTGHSSKVSHLSDSHCAGKKCSDRKKYFVNLLVSRKGYDIPLKEAI